MNISVGNIHVISSEDVEIFVPGRLVPWKTNIEIKNRIGKATTSSFISVKKLSITKVMNLQLYVYMKLVRYYVFTGLLHDVGKLNTLMTHRKTNSASLTDVYMSLYVLKIPPTDRITNRERSLKQNVKRKNIIIYTI